MGKKLSNRKDLTPAEIKEIRARIRRENQELERVRTIGSNRAEDVGRPGLPQDEYLAMCEWDEVPE